MSSPQEVSQCVIRAFVQDQMISFLMQYMTERINKPTRVERRFFQCFLDNVTESDCLHAHETDGNDADPHHFRIPLQMALSGFGRFSCSPSRGHFFPIFGARLVVVYSESCSYPRSCPLTLFLPPVLSRTPPARRRRGFTSWLASPFARRRPHRPEPGSACHPSQGCSIPLQRTRLWH